MLDHARKVNQSLEFERKNGTEKPTKRSSPPKMQPMTGHSSLPQSRQRPPPAPRRSSVDAVLKFRISSRIDFLEHALGEF